MATNDVAELAVIGTVGGQQHVHTLHFKHLGVSTTEDQLIDQWQAACEAAYKALFTDQDQPIQTMRASQVCGTVPLRAPAEQTPASTLGTRSVLTDPEPPFVAELVSERTAFAGRSYRGRFYISGLQEGDKVGSYLTNSGSLRYVLTTAYLTALLGAFGPSGSSLDLRLFVYSRKLASVPGVECQDTGAEVTGFVHPLLLSTMRSRRPGSGS
jgi:hypothetical protein